MTQFIESFFDDNTSGFKLWSKKITDIRLNNSDILFKGFLQKINRKNNKLKERYFILTKNQLFYLKSDKNNKIRGVMETEWVRVEFLNDENEKDKQYCIRFIRNMKYCDFYAKNEESLKEWRTNLAKVFIQSDFHEKFNAIKMVI